MEDDKSSNPKTLGADENLEPYIEVLPTTTVLYRCVQVRYGPSLYFDKRHGLARFNVKDGTTYAATTWSCAICETLLHKPQQAKFRFVTTEDLALRGMVALSPRRPLRLLRFHGSALTGLGDDASLTSTLDYKATCALAQSVFDHPAKVDGVIFRSRVNNDLFCVAIFSRPDLGFDLRDLGALNSPDNLPRVRAIFFDLGWIIKP